jgi:hypothetical protein
MHFFFKSKKPTNEQQLYDVCFIYIVCGACLNFFYLILKDGSLENFDRFLKIALPFNCLNTSVWARWKCIFNSKIRKVKKTQQQQRFFSIFFC